MARRRTHTPPFEIMGKGPPPPAPPGRADAEPGDAPPRAWWRSFDEPVILRVPRGLAVLMLVAAVAIVVLAYWVGHQRGVTAGKQAVEDRLAGQQNVLRVRPAPTVPDTSGEGDSVEARRPGEEPRQPGLRYFVLAHYPRNAVGRTEADRLVAFLEQYGVEAEAVISDNERFLSVVALRGFTEAEVRTPALRTYRQKLQSIGRDWKTAHGGRGSDLSDLYLDVYEGP